MEQQIPELHIPAETAKISALVLTEPGFIKAQPEDGFVIQVCPNPSWAGAPSLSFGFILQWGKEGILCFPLIFSFPIPAWHPGSVKPRLNLSRGVLPDFPELEFGAGGFLGESQELTMCLH